MKRKTLSPNHSKINQSSAQLSSVSNDSSSFLKSISKHPAFLSNSKRILVNEFKTKETPGPGDYAQYSSIHYPLVFPKGDNRDTYIMYENGRMTRKYQTYSISKGGSYRYNSKYVESPGPGAYNINSTSFRKPDFKKIREKGKLIVCNLTSPSIPSNNVYNDSSSDEEEIINSIRYRWLDQSRRKTKKRWDHNSLDVDRFSKIIDSMKSENSSYENKYVDNSFISKGRIIKVIRKGPKKPVGPGSYDNDPILTRK